MPTKRATIKPAQFRALDDQVRFLRSWLENPLKTGAVAPSSKHLARAMAAVIDPALSGPVIELGPGTGAVTEALIAHGIAPERIIVIEFSRDFVPLLAKRFPGVTVLHGDAYALKEQVRAISQDKACAVVSSLPLFTEPSARRMRMVSDAFDLMHPGAPFIQFSYALVSPVPRSIAGMVVEISDWILKNVPPARVWTYRRR